MCKVSFFCCCCFASSFHLFSTILNFCCLLFYFPFTKLRFLLYLIVKQYLSIIKSDCFSHFDEYLIITSENNIMKKYWPQRYDHISMKTIVLIKLKYRNIYKTIKLKYRNSSEGELHLHRFGFDHQDEFAQQFGSTTFVGNIFLLHGIRMRTLVKRKGNHFLQCMTKWKELIRKK